MNTTTLHRLGLFALTLTAVFIFGASCGKTATVTDPRAAQVAQALTDAGVKFYGAFWCPHCEDQRALFGEAVTKLPYVECSTPDKRAQLPVCVEAGIDSYPTWDFGPGEQGQRDRYEGVLSIDELIDRANLKIASPDQPGPVAPQ